MATIALITGAAYGIGRATAERLLSEGFVVYGADKDTAQLGTLSHENFHPVKMDVRVDADVVNGVQKVIDEQGRIDHLFANAGYCLLGPVELQAPADVADQFDVNVVGIGRVVSAVLPHMRKAGAGRIAICSSAAGHVGMGGMAWYPATKFALQGLAQGLRQEMAEFGIKVSLIEPGYIRTHLDVASLPTLDKCEQHENAPAYAHQMKTFRKKWSDGIANGAKPETIANAVHKAFTDAKPRRRYHPNMDARAAYYIKRIFGDGLLDMMVPRSSIR
ncbi:hypothetical protein ACMU_14595 [Actibacterium mucosum KCTC 23349]|uniref:Short-chain dehydrogenase n=1 Tax=Actibacterium mucosum KCTC 23349 TaxID=1454373 RepID=A0A037ZEU8_9RHOB|nr:SDR family oxidoreductase [Actibacterium mucosum]KAJ54985.1 hypothetical protein ACMU_14595 [Actibacterium mucosum KCTC 23349]